MRECLKRSLTPPPPLHIQFDPMAELLSIGDQSSSSTAPLGGGVISRKSLLIKLPCVLDGVSGVCVMCGLWGLHPHSIYKQAPRDYDGSGTVTCPIPCPSDELC